MEVITDKNSFLNTVDYLKNCNKSVGRFAFNGTLHKGHIHILEKVRPECDILVADLVHYVRFYPTIRANIPIDINLVEKQLTESSVKIDFFIFNNFCDNIEEKRKEIKEKFFEKFISYSKLVNLSIHLVTHSLSMEFTTPIDFVSTSYLGAKNAVTVLVAEKLLERKLSWPWKIVWSCYRGTDNSLTSRSRGSIVLSKIVLQAVEQIKKGITDISSFEKLMHIYFIQDPKFTILDLKTAERLESLSDNCVLVFSEGKKNDFIFIKEGELIF
jgi:hypothetical protein